MNTAVKLGARKIKVAVCLISEVSVQAYNTYQNACFAPCIIHLPIRWLIFHLSSHTF